MSTTSTHKPFSGKVALVTGGSRSIGAAVVRRLAADGAAVAFTYVASAEPAIALVKEIEAAGGTALAIFADAGDPAAVKAAVEKTATTFGGKVDILVNNAGIAIVKPTGDFTLEDFDRIVDVNVKGVVVATQEALKYMGNGGRIINIGSINSEYVPYGGGGLYVLTKAAVAGWTQAAARDLGPRGITINNVMPGPTNTDMNPETSDFAALAKTYIAVQRYAQPAEIADAVAYLASPGAGFITGANVPVDGGYSA